MITDDRLAGGVSLMDGAVLIYPSYYRIIRNLFPRAKDKRARVTGRNLSNR